ncbi:zinc ribbon domain-containing protein, partial [Verrucomicrobiota bacterium]
LLVVQERDRRIARCLNEFNNIPVRQKAIETNTSQRREAWETAKDTLKTKQASIHQLDVEIEAERGQVTKLREQQFQIKSNDEYKALNHEIAHIQEKIKELEDREIELLEDIETAEADVASIESELGAEEISVKQEVQELEKRRRVLESEIDEIKKDRDMLSSDIEPDWLSRYNRIMENRKDFALVGMDKNSTCGSCHMKLPPQMMHDVRKGDTMVSCTYCSRLLYWTG